MTINNTFVLKSNKLKKLSYKDGRHSASDNTSYIGIDVLPRHSGCKEAKCQKHDGK